VVLGDGESLPPPAPEGATAAITSYQPEAVDLQVVSPAPAMVVLTDTACDGWTARVNGGVARIYTANGMFRAVAVPAGNSRVEFRYEPRGYVAGRTLSLIALALIFAGCAWSAIRRRRGGRKSQIANRKSQEK
ncbi:MAG: YfhO family protein, partial [Acidobacteria bacterium]|nr:YfhO family protein [Acidobacteriota bacterium]